MRFTRLMAVVLVLWTLGRARTEQVEPPAPLDTVARISELSLAGEIEGENIAFKLSFTAEADEAKVVVPLVAGDVVALDDPGAARDGVRLEYDPERKLYTAAWAGKGTRRFELAFAARPTRMDGDGAWREVSFMVPEARVRNLEVLCDRADLEVRFPGALRLQRETVGEKLRVTAMLGPNKPFICRWKPHVREMEGRLVLSTTVNTIATAAPGAMRIDSLFTFDISQGKLDQLRFRVPDALSVTQVRGEHIRDWALAGQGEAHILTVTLNRSQTRAYALQVLGEAPLPPFPAEVELPVIRPEEGLRSSGHLALGTDSAIQLVVEQSAGLSQIESDAFPRLLLERRYGRRLPAEKLFCYKFATSGYGMRLALDDITPSYDASHRLAATLSEEDMVVTADIELDIRDAPLRSVAITAPAGFMVSSATGAEVDDYTVRDPAGGEALEAFVQFKRPALGRTVVTLRFELGKSPLGETQTLTAPAVKGARNERGFLVVAAEEGVRMETPTFELLNTVPVGSAPMRVPNAQFAYRFREAGWTLTLDAARNPSGILSEAFHIVSLGEGILYGSVTVNYLVTGAPVDEFRFAIPEDLANVEFIGEDVRRWRRDGEVWTVSLRRKVMGEYNLGLAYSLRYASGSEVPVGGIACEGVQQQTGYVVVSSHLNLKLEGAEADGSLMPIEFEEVPGAYRQLVSAPVVKTFKYDSAPRPARAMVNAYDRAGMLPALIEMANATTELAPQKDADTQSVTTIRYKVKNIASQFLTLRPPAGALASTFSAHVIQRDGKGGESSTRAMVSQTDEGLLKIPLPRLSDPNAPVTVELIYGCSHGQAAPGDVIVVEAPQAQTRSTYAEWVVRAPKEWGVLPAEGGGMRPSPDDVSEVGLPVALREAGQAWARAGRLAERGGFVLLGAVGLLAGFAAFFWRRRLGAWLCAATLLALLVAAGLYAADRGDFRSAFGADVHSVRFERALTATTQEDPSLSVAVFVRPAWRAYAGWDGLFVAPLLALIAVLLAALKPRFRLPLAALAVVAASWSAAQFPLGALAIGHALTWGIPAVLALWFLERTVKHVRGARREAALAGLTLLLCASLPGCAGVLPPREPFTLTGMETELSVDDDSMDVTINAAFVATEATRRLFLAQPGVMLTGEDVAPDVKLVEDGGDYYLETEKAVERRITVRFLAPLPSADEAQARRFRLGMPLALLNRVVLKTGAKDQEIRSATAYRLTAEETDEGATARAIFGPGEDVQFEWKPRARETRLEKTVFYADVTSLLRFDSGLVSGSHRVHFQIAQGQLETIRILVPEKMTVTSVDGEGLGAWRFDPATRELEARLAQPVAGEYALAVATQMASDPAPYTISAAPLAVKEAERQRNLLGLASGPAVFVEGAEGGSPINVDDFARDAAAVLSGPAAQPVSEMRFAYRLQTAEDRVVVRVNEVTPEIRAIENATFTVADDRLVYNGEVTVSVSKAGVFSALLAIPAGYDIDTLEAPEISHWDDAREGGRRSIRVHFRRKLLGTTTVRLAMSRAIAELPGEIAAPRVVIEHAAKLEGRLVVSSARGVRLSVAKRDGVSELDPAELGLRVAGALVFKILKPDWDLSLRAETIEPRIEVEFLHLATVFVNRTRNEHHLRYALHNAGLKVFEIQAPPGALGLTISGPAMTQATEAEPGSGRWRVELSDKWFGRPYPMVVRYDTEFAEEGGQVVLTPLKALDADLQRGYVAARSAERIELSVDSEDASLVRAAREDVRRRFGVPDVENAALCYRTATADYRLPLGVRRHEAAPGAGARVLKTELATTVSEDGATITRAVLTLRVWNKRNLRCGLPEDGAMWSLWVNGRPTAPARAEGGAGELLIPLGQSSEGELPVTVDFVYVQPPPREFGRRWRFQVPKFDLPLSDIQWRLYAPENYDYSDFDGDLAVDKDMLGRPRSVYYGASRYESEVDRTASASNTLALEYQRKAFELASEGRQQEAQQALEYATNYSFADQALNEDARVQLHLFRQKQAVYNIVQRRGELRQRGGPAQEEVQAPQQQSLEDMERIERSLSKEDSDNLRAITRRMIEIQEAASVPAEQILINVPFRGRELLFRRPLQVKPETEMAVSFAAKPKADPAARRTWLWAAGLFVGLCALFGVVQAAFRAVESLPEWRWADGSRRGGAEHPSAGGEATESADNIPPTE